MGEIEDEEIGDYSVEIAVTGTWRESVVAHSPEEAEEVVEQNIRKAIDLEEGEWGDLGFKVIGAREENPDE